MLSGVCLVVVKVNDHNRYHVKMDGSGRFSQRNEQFLKRIVIVSYVVVHSSIADPGVVSNLVTCEVAEEVHSCTRLRWYVRLKGEGPMHMVAAGYSMKSGALPGAECAQRFSQGSGVPIRGKTCSYI